MRHPFVNSGILLLCVLFATGSVTAQTTTPYFFFKPIYAFPANKVKLNETMAQINGQTFTKGVYGSYGRGLCLQAGVGKMISSTFGFEISGEYGFGQSIHTKNQTADSTAADLSDRVKSLLIKPVIVIRNSGDLLTVYTKLGLAIEVLAHRYETLNVLLPVSGQIYNIYAESTESAKAKVGVTAAFGLSFRVTERTALFAEVNGQMLSLPITRGHYTTNRTNGVEQLPNLSTSQSSWVYQESGVFGAVLDPNKPEPRLSEPANLSYLGISVGILIHF